MRAIVFFIIRELIAAGALSSLMGKDNKNQERIAGFARDTLVSVAKRLFVVAIAILFFVIAAGFLIAAAYMQLSISLTAPFAALIMGSSLAVIGLVVLFFSKERGTANNNENSTNAARHQNATENQSEESSFNVGQQGLTDTIQRIVTSAQTIFAEVSKNTPFMIAVAVMIGLWMGSEKKDKKDKEKND